MENCSHKAQLRNVNSATKVIIGSWERDTYLGVKEDKDRKALLIDHRAGRDG